VKQGLRFLSEKDRRGSRFIGCGLRFERGFSLPPVFSGALLSGFELVHVLNLGRLALLALRNLAGAGSTFWCK